MKLSLVIEELVEERGLDRSLLADIITESIVAAYQKKYPDEAIKAFYNKKTDELEVACERTVVAQVADEETEVSLRRARNISPKAEVGDIVLMPFEGKVGRIEILKAKQIIAQRIRAIESQAVHDEFVEKQGSVVHGVVHKCEYGGMSLKVGDTMAFLPKTLLIPGDKCVVGLSVRALLKEVLLEPRNDNQLVLDRISVQFVQKLFELEVPEIFENLVEIKKIVRTPGYKTKVAVISNDPNIDPVGTCVGVGGVRIKPILKELGSEKIDVIAWTESLPRLIADALKPAVINKVELVDDKNAQVWLDDDQRSLAIGKMGQNIALACQMTGVSIHLVESRKIDKVVSEDLSSEETFQEN